MKIGHPQGQGPIVPAGPASTQGAEANKGAKAPEKVESGTKVELSSEASKLLVEGKSTPEFDQAKVARIAQAISDGSYQINAEAIADKLIAHAQELLGKPNP